LTFKARTRGLTEVVLTQSLAGTTAAGITVGDTNVPKAIAQFTAVANSQVNPADQAGGALRIRVTVALALGARTVLMTKIRITMAAAHTATATTGLLTKIGCLIAGLTSTTRITAMG
jgi:hypothetical protein